MHAMQVLAAAAGGTGGQVVPARAQMATTLGFHIILACFGIAFPTIVLVAEFRGLSRSDDVAMLLARRWSQVMGVLVAVGAVTGTVLSFEMGLLWPGLMRTYGAVLGVPFGFEGIFFFLEAIFTGIYLYGWQRLPGWTHFYTGIPIALTGLGGRCRGDGRELLDEPAGRVHAQPRAGRGRRSLAGLFQPGDAV
jgi:cytochrome bd ubiquinol oxidase subunit I